jgi:hypothetical protein
MIYLLDTNVLISAALFPGSPVDRALAPVVTGDVSTTAHHLAKCSL